MVFVTYTLGPARPKITIKLKKMKDALEFCPWIKKRLELKNLDIS